MSNRRICPLCGSDQSIDFYIPYAECNHCGIIYVPDVHEGLLDYEEDYYFFDSISDRQNLKRAKYFYSLVRRELEGYSNAFRLLDVGSGTGHFVSVACQSGMDALGVDISEFGVKKSRAKWGREKFYHFTEIKELLSIFAPLSFDLVTLWEVIEHLKHPIQLSNMVFQLLKPGGKFFLSTPNVGGGYVSLLGSRWHGFREPMPRYHITYFRKNSLELLLTKVGFRDVRVRSTSPPYAPLLLPRNLSSLIVPDSIHPLFRRPFKGLIAGAIFPLVAITNLILNRQNKGDTLIARAIK